MDLLIRSDNVAFDADFDYDALVEEVRTVGELHAILDPDHALSKSTAAQIALKREAGLDRETLETVKDAVAAFGLAQMGYGKDASREGAIYVGGVGAALGRIGKILDWLSADSQE